MKRDLFNRKQSSNPRTINKKIIKNIRNHCKNTPTVCVTAIKSTATTNFEKFKV